MATPLRILHYINAFFGGLGGEEEALAPMSFHPDAIGPGRLLEQALAGQGEVAATVICGDGYFSEHEEEVAAQFRDYVQTHKPDVVIAGPAFRSGRYGLACGRLCLEANRIVRGGQFHHPFGVPDRPSAEEAAWRRAFVERVIEILCTPVEHPTVFDVEATVFT